MNSIYMFPYYFLFSLSSLFLTPNDVQFDLTFGRYMNDHSERQFYTWEQHWTLDNGTLSYTIQELDALYTDEIELTNDDIQLIYDFLTDVDFNQSTNQMNEDINDVILKEVSERIEVRGDLQLKDTEYKFDLRSNDKQHLIDHSSAAKLYELEQLLYKIVDKY